MKTKLTIFNLIILTLINLQSGNAQMFWNQAASFSNSTTSYVSVRNSTPLNITGSYTLEAWVNPSTLVTGTLGIVYKSKTLFKYFLSLDNTGRIRLGNNNAIRLLSRVSTAISVNNWSHIAGTYNVSTNVFKIYINGVLDTSSTIAGVTPTSNTDSLYIGNAGITTAFPGQLDEVRIWNRDLSNSEISQNRFTSLGATGGIYEGLVFSTTFQDANSVGTDFGTQDMSGLNINGFSRNVSAVDLGDNPSSTIGQNECLQFDGTDDYVSGPDVTAISPATGITLECWVHPLILTTCRFISNGSGASPNYALTMGSVVSAVINGNTITGAGTPTLKQWTHIAFTYSASTGKFNFYRNGIVVDTGTAAFGNINNGTDSIFIGGGPGFTDLNGFMDEVRIASYVKSQDEIINYMYESIDEGNNPSGGRINVVYNLDGLAIDNANAGGPRLFFRNNARFSRSTSVANQPVSPLNRADAMNFSQGFYLKTFNKRIPSAGTTGVITDSVTINLNQTISDINFYVALNHINSANLEITLVAPNGDSVKVFDNNTTSSNSDNIVTVFDDNADNIMINGSYVTFSNNIRPVANMNSVFAGDKSQGKWKIRITDIAGSDTGIAYAWGVQINNQTLREKNLNMSGLIQGFFNTSTGLMIPDTIKVIMRSSVTPFAKIDSASAVLNNIGDALLSYKGNTVLNNTNYYLQVRHRNSIETWSSTLQKFSFSELNYNFRNTLANAFGSNMIFLASAPQRFGFFSGDVNQDGVIDASDAGLTDNAAASFVTGYVNTDITGDEVVDASDAAIVDNNAANFVSAVTP